LLERRENQAGGQERKGGKGENWGNRLLGKVPTWYVKVTPVIPDNHVSSVLVGGGEKGLTFTENVKSRAILKTEKGEWRCKGNGACQ